MMNAFAMIIPHNSQINVKFTFFCELFENNDQLMALDTNSMRPLSVGNDY